MALKFKNLIFIVSNTVRFLVVKLCLTQDKRKSQEMEKIQEKNRNEGRSDRT